MLVAEWVDWFFVFLQLLLLVSFVNYQELTAIIFAGGVMVIVVVVLVLVLVLVIVIVAVLLVLFVLLVVLVVTAIFAAL